MRFIFKYIIISWMLLLSFTILAQDIHFSQYDSSPLNLNPALTGRTDCDFRFVLNHRNQWQSVTVPYRTLSGSFDMKYVYSNASNIYFGAGILINTDKAGDSEFGINQAKVNGAMHYMADKDSSLIVSLGLCMNMTQNSINYSNLQFGDQYDGSQYNDNLSTNEVFNEKNLQYIDFTAGIHVGYLINNRIPVNGGFTLYHLNRPKQSFYLDKSIVLDRRFLIHVNSALFSSNKTQFLPSILIMGQGKYREINVGGLIKFRTNKPTLKSVLIGGWYRFKDAGIVKLAIEYQNLTLGFSYDINTSTLYKASNGRGGLELSLIYNLCKRTQVAIPSLKQCPEYM